MMVRGASVLSWANHQKTKPCSTYLKTIVPASSRDSSRVLVDIGNGTPDHINNMIKQVNTVKADAWSPLAEAVFSAIGYYTQRPDMRINTSDFSMGGEPCTHWCQNNNILVITDGASTVDLHPG